jgi:hypothetical protein
MSLQLPAVDKYLGRETKESAESNEHLDLSTVDKSTANPDLGFVSNRPETSVTTVVTSERDPATVSLLAAETPKTSDMPLVDRSKPGAPRLVARVKLWQTAKGQLVPDARVKQIRLAQDVINSAEEAVYDALWRDPSGSEEGSTRIVQAGYDHLTKRTRLSRKTVQRIVAKLIDKDFIEIAKPADIYQRTSTVYRVFNYHTVLDRHKARGRKHVAKVGPGFSYVWEIADTQQPSTPDVSTIVKSNVSTVVNESPLTVVKLNLSTVARETTSSIGNNFIEQTPSSQAIYEALSKFGTVDDDVLQLLTAGCRVAAPDCTEDEIVHFIQRKAPSSAPAESETRSAFFLATVPKCFVGESFRHFRAEQGRLRKEQAEAEMRAKIEAEERRREQHRELLDPATPEDHKAILRRLLGIS